MPRLLSSTGTLQHKWGWVGRGAGRGCFVDCVLVSSSRDIGSCASLGSLTLLPQWARGLVRRERPSYLLRPYPHPFTAYNRLETPRTTAREELARGEAVSAVNAGVGVATAVH